MRSTLVACWLLSLLPLPTSSLAPIVLPEVPLTHASCVLNASPLLATTTSAAFNPFSLYMSTLASHPLPTKMITGATLAVAGDAIAQSREIDHVYDKTRAISFAAFDMSYRALQHVAFPIIVAHCQGQYLSSIVDTQTAAAVEQTLASQLGIVPFLYYPVFYALTGWVQQLSLEATLDRAKTTFLPLMQRNLLFWLPIQFIQFSFVPQDLQIPFLCVCGLCWTFILSVMAGSTKEFQEKENESNTPYCVTGMEGECVLPDDLFPHTTPEAIGLELQHELEDMVHAIEDELEEVVHKIEDVVSHDILALAEEPKKVPAPAIEEEKEEELVSF